MLTRRVAPTCLMSPTRPMIVNSAIVFITSFLFHLLGPSAHAVGPSGAARRKSAGRASTREERAGRSVERRTVEGGDFVARGIRPSGRRGKSPNEAVAARPVRLHGRS